MSAIYMSVILNIYFPIKKKSFCSKVCVPLINLVNIYFDGQYVCITIPFETFYTRNFLYYCET